MLGVGALSEFALCDSSAHAPSSGPDTRVRGGAWVLWTDSLPHNDALACPYADPERGDRPHALPWAIAQARDDSAVLPWGFTSRAGTDCVPPWGVPILRDAHSFGLPWDSTRTAAREARPLPWGIPGRREAVGVLAPWGSIRQADTGTEQPWGIPARAERVLLALGYSPARPADLDGRHPWGYGARRDSGTDVEIGGGEPPTDEHGTLLIPVRRMYFVLSEAFLVRLSDNEPIPCINLTVGIDVDSWTWSFSAALWHTAWPLVTGPEPVAVRATVNGYAFEALVERVDRVRRFGQTQLRATGRGRHAVLAEPYARPETRTHAEARTAQQLAAEPLEFTDWTLDWQIPDWLVPAGAWSHQGTPIQAITTLAQAAGGYVQGDPVLDVLHVLPRYPAWPWAWAEATPDVQLPPDVLVEESLETVERPAYNAVYVAGVSQGLVALVKRAGSAGDLVAPLVTDPLTTHADAARGRGGAVLADTGRQHRITLSLPVSADVPLLTPGLLVEVLDGGGYRALARSLSLSAAWSGDNGLSVRQSVGLERHLIEEE